MLLTISPAGFAWAAAAAAPAASGAAVDEMASDTTADDGPAVELAQSWIHATFKKLKTPVTGTFTQFSGQIAFDPAKPAAGRVRLAVRTTSFTLKDSKQNRDVRGASWLDVEQFPVARFVSSAIVAAGGGKYSVAGKLTLHGKTLNVMVPVSYTQIGDVQVFDGVLPIRSQQFGIGGGTETMLIADQVVLSFHLLTRTSP